MIPKLLPMSLRRGSQYLFKENGHNSRFNLANSCSPLICIFHKEIAETAFSPLLIVCDLKKWGWKY